MTILIHPLTKEEREFEDKHAKRILGMKPNGGWTLKVELKAKKSDDTGSKKQSEESKK